MIIDERCAISVSQVNLHIKTLIETDEILKSIWIKGEISNFKAHSSGHFYFTLKDEGGVLSAVMFRSSAQRVKFRPQNGMRVLVCASVRVYEPMGAYQAYVTAMKEDGEGDLHVAFEQLKQRLQAEGLFDAAHKKPLPRFPQRIGLVTSPTGAAVRDMLNIMGRRFKCAEIYIYPAAVQGEDAPQQLTQGVKFFDESFGVDVIVIGRGGGSIEDLWAFNNENLARAVYACGTPIVSAVGHEIDFTITDFVADLRAATPSEAAERVVPNGEEWRSRLENAKSMLCGGLEKTVKLRRMQLEQYRPGRVFEEFIKSIDDRRIYTDAVFGDAARAAKLICERSRASLAKNAALLDSLSPLKVLARGYSVAFGENGKVITDAENVKIGEKIAIKLQNGELGARVEEKNGQ